MFLLNVHKYFIRVFLNFLLKCIMKLFKIKCYAWNTIKSSRVIFK